MKKFLALLCVCLLLAGSFTACGSKDTSAATDTSSTSTETNTDAGNDNSNAEPVLISKKTITDKENNDTFTESYTYNSNYQLETMTWEDGTWYSTYCANDAYYTAIPADFPYSIYIGDFLSGYSCYASGSLTCSYDANGNLTEIKAPEFSITFTYDANNLLTTERVSNSEVIYIYEYQYNDNGQITGALMNNETAKTYTYDAHGSLAKIEYATIPMGNNYFYDISEEFTYTNDGILASALYKEETTGEMESYYNVQVSYDEWGNVTERIQSYGFGKDNGATEKDTYEYQYNENGMPTSCKLTVLDTSGAETVCNYTYQYE